MVENNRIKIQEENLQLGTLQSDRPLKGKTILITRGASQAEEFATTIRNLGGTPVIFSTIEIHPPESWRECDNALAAINTYDALLFTSVNGVEFFFRRVIELKIPAGKLQAKDTYTVGPRTKRTAKDHSLSVVAIPERFTGHDLAAIFKTTKFLDKRFLFPHGNLGGATVAEHLRGLGTHIDEIIVYHTKRPQQKNIEDIRTLLTDGKVDVVTFASPSSVKNFAAFFSPEEREIFHRTARFAVIGPATQQAAEAADMKPDILAGNSTLDSLAEAIARYYS